MKPSTPAKLESSTSTSTPTSSPSSGAQKWFTPPDFSPLELPPPLFPLPLRALGIPPALRVPQETSEMPRDPFVMKRDSRRTTEAGPVDLHPRINVLPPTPKDGNWFGVMKGMDSPSRKPVLPVGNGVITPPDSPPPPPPSPLKPVELELLPPPGLSSPHRRRADSIPHSRPIHIPSSPSKYHFYERRPPPKKRAGALTLRGCWETPETELSAKLGPRRGRGPGGVVIQGLLNGTQGGLWQGEDKQNEPAIEDCFSASPGEETLSMSSREAEGQEERIFRRHRLQSLVVKPVRRLYMHFVTKMKTRIQEFTRESGELGSHDTETAYWLRRTNQGFMDEDFAVYSRRYHV